MQNLTLHFELTLRGECPQSNSNSMLQLIDKASWHLLTRTCCQTDQLFLQLQNPKKIDPSSSQNGVDRGLPETIRGCQGGQGEPEKLFGCSTIWASPIL